jgi:hypothetical protein
MLTLANGWERIIDTPLPVLAIGAAIAIVAIVSSSIRKVLVHRARQQTKREIAAYVAEGSIDPDKAVEMLNAGERAQG